MTKEEIRENIIKEINCKSLPGEKCFHKRCESCDYYISREVAVNTLLSVLEYIRMH